MFSLTSFYCGSKWLWICTYMLVSDFMFKSKVSSSICRNEIYLNSNSSWKLLPAMIWYNLSYIYTSWKVSKYGVFSGLYFPAFGLNTPYLSVFSLNVGKYGPEKTPYLHTFHAVLKEEKTIAWLNWCIWVYRIYCRKYQFTFIRQNIYKIV